MEKPFFIIYCSINAIKVSDLFHAHSTPISPPPPSNPDPFHPHLGRSIPVAFAYRSMHNAPSMPARSADPLNSCHPNTCLMWAKSRICRLNNALSIINVPERKSKIRIHIPYPMKCRIAVRIISQTAAAKTPNAIYWFLPPGSPFTITGSVSPPKMPDACQISQRQAKV